MRLLDNQVCIVTGAGQGLGEAISLEMAREGATLVLLERNPDTAEKVATRIRANGGKAEPYAMDVTDYGAYREVVDNVVSTFGGIDVLVNNAAINPATRTILEDTLDDWRRTIAVNLEAVYMG